MILNTPEKDRSFLSQCGWSCVMTGLVIVSVLTAACTTTSQNPTLPISESPPQTLVGAPTSAPTSAKPDNTIQQTIKPVNLVTSLTTTILPPTGTTRTVIDETVPLIGGVRSSAKKYSFQDLGVDLSHPNDTFLASVRAEKPINILVTDYRGQGDYNGVNPVWEKQLLTKTTNSHLYGWSYPGIWYLVKQDEVYEKEFTFTVTDPGAYYLILDPQTINEQLIESGSWQTKHDNFNVNVKIVQIPGSNGVEIGPKYPFFINETTALYDGDRPGYKEYPLEDYGLDFLRPDESFLLSVTAEKPVNVMVLDANNENKFGTVQPIYEMQPIQKDTGAQYGYSYPGLSSLVKEDKVVRKEIPFTVKDLGKYYIILDPRFADPQSNTVSFFRARVSLSKV